MAITTPHSSDDLELVESLLREANFLVRRLRLPSNQRHLYDDIVQETMLIALRKIRVLAEFESERRSRWIFATMLLVSRNAKRSEARRNAMCERFRGVFRHDTTCNYFDRTSDDRFEQLGRALVSLGELDRDLIIGHAWSGFSAAELASQHHMTTKSVQHRISRARATARKFGSGGEIRCRADIDR